MRGIQSTWWDPDSFPELLSVTKADPNNFCFLHFTVSGWKSTVGRKKERKKERRRRTQVKTMAYRVAFGARKACGARNTGVPKVCVCWGGGVVVVDHIPSTISHQPKHCCVKVWSWSLGWTVTIWPKSVENWVRYKALKLVKNEWYTYIHTYESDSLR